MSRVQTQELVQISAPHVTSLHDTVPSATQGDNGKSIYLQRLL